ncbi:MAG TPA: serine/threonine-protein kinase [Kofleriaceae bacterium]
MSTTPGPAAIGADDRELAPGLDVGEYRIESVLGRGGFGTVYGAVQPVIGKRVAIKVLARRYAADQDIVSRFAAEARAVNQIRHRNIIDIFSFGQLPDGRHYYVMEHLDGEPLDTYIRTHGAMPLDQAIPVLRAIARALDAAHAKGIAHRDLKPENIFLANDPDGGVFPKLLDFGIAKLLAPEDNVMHRTGTGVPIGTPYYMSPEQCRGRDVDHRTDIYSFGVVIYRLLTGAFPFEGDFMELLFKQVNEEPALPTSINAALPESVNYAIAWMMQKDPEQRPKAVLEGVNALDPSIPVTQPPSLRGSRPSLPPTGRGPQNTPADLALAETGVSSPNALTTAAPQRRSRLPLLAGVVLALATLGTGAYIVTREPPPPPSAQQPEPVQPALTTHVVVDPPQPEAVIAVDAAVTPDRVQLTFVGVPPGAEVLRDGKPLGVVPKLKLPYGTEAVDLVLHLDGFQPLPVTVIPDRDQDVPAKMKRKAGRPNAPARDDLASPFDKNK